GPPWLIVSGLPVDRLRSRQLKIAAARGPEPGCRRFDGSQHQLRINPKLRTQPCEALMERAKARERRVDPLTGRGEVAFGRGLDRNAEQVVDQVEVRDLLAASASRKRAHRAQLTQEPQ